MRFVWVSVALSACVALPEGWQGADPVEDFEQSACTGGGGDPDDSDAPEPEVAAVADGDDLTVTAVPVRFRCAQEVEAFWKQDGDAVSVLVQPVNMHPRTVAKCDCPYRVEATIGAAGAGSASVWSRSDAKGGGENAPVEVGEAVVE